ncbi:16S rRNA (adenine(1518)-N(6)/adenine(1519)-N(6))-dimethyltransferase RsmA [Limibacillus halophilus]
MSEPELPPLREVIARHDLGAKKALGQHFLFDMNLTRRIARAAGDLSQGTTIEVGPGPGGLTRALLLEGAGKLVAIERDERCLAALAELGAAFPGRFQVISADALETPVEPLGPAPRRIVANLPYNVSTQLLIGWLELIAREPDALSCLVLMFQKEVAQRLTAKPRSKDYGRLTILTQWLCEVEPLFDISPKAFVPPPKVTSTVVELRPRPAPAFPAEIASLQKVTAAAFGQRRKMLRQSLKSLGGDAQALLEAAGIKETARAEELTLEDFCRLAEVWRQTRRA